MPKGKYPRRKPVASEQTTLLTNSGQEVPYIPPDPNQVEIVEVRYERVFPVPNTRFGTERIALTAAVHPGQAVNHVIHSLKKTVLRNSTDGEELRKKAAKILGDPNSHSFREVSWAQAYMETVEE